MCFFTVEFFDGHLTHFTHFPTEYIDEILWTSPPHFIKKFNHLPLVNWKYVLFLKEGCPSKRLFVYKLTNK